MIPGNRCLLRKLEAKAQNKCVSNRLYPIALTAPAVLLAANLGEDADTTAAITGQLAGALYGASAIPTQWRQRLAWGERLTRGGLRLFAASLHGTDEERLTDSLAREWDSYLREADRT